jgi:Tfp pilus assembly protein PilX
VRRGFALPLALFLLLLSSLLVAMLLDGALQELRTARGDVALARAQAAAGSALADLLSSRPDSTMLALSRGSTITGTTVTGADTTHLTIQSLGRGLLRVTAASRTWSGGVRGDASNLGFVRVLPDSAGAPGALRYRRIPGWWWAPIP